MDNEGAVQGNEYHAFRSNMKISAKITDWLEIGANVNFQDRLTVISKYHWVVLLGC